MVSILTEDTGPESHLFAATGPLSAIFRPKQDPGAHVTSASYNGKFFSEFGLSGSASAQDTIHYGVCAAVSSLK